MQKRDREYFIVAIIYAGAGWVFGMLALREAVDPATYPWALGGWMAMMLLGAGSLPGAIADARSERALLAMLPLLRAGWFLLRWPLVMPLFAATHLAMRALRLQHIETDNPADVQNKVMAAVADHVDQDGLADAERIWIGNILALKDQQVSTVMTPRPDIIALPETITLREAVDQALEHEFSRYPVYRERIDEVVGIFAAFNRSVCVSTHLHDELVSLLIDYFAGNRMAATERSLRILSRRTPINEAHVSEHVKNVDL